MIKKDIMNQTPKISVLINPKSGHGRGRRLYETLTGKTDRLIAEHVRHVKYTEAGGNSAVLKRLAGDSQVIVICGGDGTVHHVINDLVTAGIENVAISIFPIGTGNDLARSVGTYPYRDDILSLLTKIITSPHYVSLDLFALNDAVCFSNYVGFGYDAGIISAYEASVHRLKGCKIFEINLLKKFLYLVVGLWKSVSYRPKMEEIKSDRSLINVIISNLRTYAGGSIIADKASMSDGRPEITCIRSKLDFTKLILNRFSLFPFAMTNEPAGLPFRFRVAAPVPVQIDGEDYSRYFESEDEFTVTHRTTITLAL